MGIDDLEEFDDVISRHWFPFLFLFVPLFGEGEGGKVEEGGGDSRSPDRADAQQWIIVWFSITIRWRLIGGRRGLLMSTPSGTDASKQSR